MYKLLSVVILAAVVLSPADCQSSILEEAVKAHADCRNEVSISDDAYEKFTQYQLPENLEPNNCYLKCFISKLGLYSDVGGLNAEAILTQLSRLNPEDVPIVTETIRKCVDPEAVAKGDPCLTINTAVGCWLKSNREVVLKVLGA